MNSPEDYKQIAAVVESRGYVTKMRGSGSGLICGTRVLPSGSFVGVSFWVLVYKGVWYVCSWNYRYWRVPCPNSLPEICLEWLRRGRGAMPPADIIQTYGLEAIPYDSFGEIFLESSIPAILKDIHTAQAAYYERYKCYAQTLNELENAAWPELGLFQYRAIPWLNPEGGYEICMTVEETSWSAVARSPRYDEVYSIDANGTLTVDSRSKDDAD